MEILAMPALDLVLTPLAVLALLAMYRFVACHVVFPHSPGPATPPEGTPYADVVTGTAGVVAFWRLAEAGGFQADDRVSVPPGPHPAVYTQVAAGLPASATLHSAAAPGTVTLGQPALREGSDALTSALLDGGFAQHPFRAELNPPQFTIEAWVRPGWTQEMQPNYHVVFAAHERAAGNRNRGVILQAGPDPASENAPSGPTFWQVRVGTDGAALETLLGPPVTFDDRAHLAVTCDGTTVTLWVNLGVEGDPDNPSASRALPAPFVPNASRPLYIGAGRTDVSGSGTPRFPFQGRIQDVSLYARALAPGEIVRHGLAGDGIQ